MIKSIHVNYDKFPYNIDMDNEQTVFDKVIEIGKKIATDLADESIINIRKYI